MAYGLCVGKFNDIIEKASLLSMMPRGAYPILILIPTFHFMVWRAKRDWVFRVLDLGFQESANYG